MDSNHFDPVHEDFCHVVREPEFTALFALGADDRPESVENIDAELRLLDGTRWSASFMTLGAIDTVMSRWRETGEYGGGVFFQCSDLVIVPKPGVAAMVEAFRAIVTEGPQGALGRLQ
ncbi:hypothetical protein ACFWP5_35550 [Streptomyces sp. NPDC058469]|uniref:hypothetical protein n=1 Tax=Streptomyces sp. NPDC058469 TaxID=3346514 RepID=UPI0036477575